MKTMETMKSCAISDAFFSHDRLSASKCAFESAFFFFGLGENRKWPFLIEERVKVLSKNAQIICGCTMRDANVWRIPRSLFPDELSRNRSSPELSRDTVTVDAVKYYLNIYERLSNRECRAK